MKNFFCNCGTQVFFENNQCLSCGSELGWCPGCAAIATIQVNENGRYTCGSPGCGRTLAKCQNYALEQVCNRCIVINDDAVEIPRFCDYCRYNETIPDLSIEGNRDKWLRIEIAKRRLFYTLDLLGAPYGNEQDNFSVPLSFDFKEDREHKHVLWFNMEEHEQVFTGHANGKITINIREADDVEREKSRVNFGEAHRTLIGHFRHEIGHYFWDVLVKGKCEENCITIFGDHDYPDYGTALQHYYENGPPPGWPSSYISAYASMHPWEDFAESFAAYLDMVSVTHTAHHALTHSIDPLNADFDAISRQYTQLGIMLNEMNRAVGLLDLAPAVHTPVILSKIEFVHDLLRNRRENSTNPAAFS